MSSTRILSMYMDRASSLAAICGALAALSLFLVMANFSPSTSEGFAIVLINEGRVVVSDIDIRYYNETSHELILTGGCADRLKPMGWRLSGNFTFIVHGRVELTGIFVPPFVSRSYPSSQVVISYPSFDMDYTVMKIQMGYPWDQPIGPDPRDNPRIDEYFRISGKLIEKRMNK